MDKRIGFSKYISFVINIIDGLIISVLFFLFLRFYYSEKGDLLITYREFFKLHYKALILFIFGWFIIASWSKIYQSFRLITFFEIIKRNLCQILLFSIIVFAVSGLKKDDLFSNRVSLIFLIAVFFLTLIIRLISFVFFKVYRHYGKNYRRAIFIDENINTYSFMNLLSKRKDYGFVNYGNFFSGTRVDIQKKIYDFDLTKIKYFILEERIQIVFFSLNGKLSQDIHDELVILTQKLHVELRFIPSTIYDSNSLNLEYYDTFPILSFKKFPLDNFWNQILKRTFDILFSVFIILFILSWLFPIIAIAIMIDSGRPVFYLQKRIGFKGNIFYCYKFRTMKASKDNDIKATVKGDARITRLGSLLRRSSLDELPQFFNVLQGNMSIVGPRPHMVVQDEYYNDMMVKYSLRHYVKPGITGLAQVKGFRGEINSKEDMQKRIIADAYYVRKWSFLLDIIIIIGTFFKTLFGDKKAV